MCKAVANVKLSLLQKTVHWDGAVWGLAPAANSLMLALLALAGYTGQSTTLWVCAAAPLALLCILGAAKDSEKLLWRRGMG